MGLLINPSAAVIKDTSAYNVVKHHFKTCEMGKL
jgi:hypothetical protein